MIIIGNAVGKVLRFIYGYCFDPTTVGDSVNVVSVPAVGVPALAKDLFRFETSSQVPEGLSKKVASSKKVQAKWYRKLLEAWKEATPPPETREEAARLVIQTLEGIQQAEIEGILAFYGLPLPAAEIPTSLPEGVQPLPAAKIPISLPEGVQPLLAAEIPTVLPEGVQPLPATEIPTSFPEGVQPLPAAEIPTALPEGVQPPATEIPTSFPEGVQPLPATEIPTSLPEGVQPLPIAEIPKSLLHEGVRFELHTLPVDAKDVGDGNGMTVYVSTADPQESKTIPREVKLAFDQRLKACAQRKHKKADKFLRLISNSGYRIINHQNEDILARKYRIRLRGIYAPEMSMPYGNEAKDELVKLVQDKCLRVLVYRLDQNDRIVADVYCYGIFVQEEMLKRGFAWHYKFYDQRLEFATWEKEARGKQVGLWASPNPEEPWEWKKKDRREGS